MRIFVLVSLFMLIFSQVKAQPGRGSFLPDSATVAQRVETLAQELDLNENQKQQVFELQWQQRNEVQQIFSENRGDWAVVREKMQQMRESYNQKILLLLTDPQQEQYNAVMANRFQNRSENIRSGRVFSVSGQVIDKKDQTFLPGAHVKLMNLRDSAQATMITSQDGQFVFTQVPLGRYQLKITYIGYENYEEEIKLFRDDASLGEIKLEPGTAILDEVEIKGQVPQSELKGDTVVFNSQAFKTNPDADAEDLIKKLPGVIVENGRVQAQGEDVKQVLVDGRQFFGQDPTLALRSLPAEVIDKIQVFDQLSEQSQLTGYDDGETTKTINIVTKANKRNGQFGKVYAGYGTDNNYKAGGQVNFFDGDTRISLIGQSNNVNQQNFATEDLLGVVGTTSNRRWGGRGGRPGGGRGAGGFRGFGGSSINDFLVGQQAGIATTHALGLNYSDQWGEKVEITGSYFFNMNQNETEQVTNQEFFLDDNENQFYHEESSSTSDNFNHRLNLRIEYDIDSANSLRIMPSLSFQDNSARSNLFGETTQAARLLNQTNNIYRSDIEGYNFSNRIFYSHRFAKRGRSLVAHLNLGANDKDGFTSLFAENQYFQNQNNLIDSIDQQTDLQIYGKNISTGVRYTEPLGQKGMLQLNYRISHAINDSERETNNFEEFTGEYSQIDSTLSNVFTNYYTTQNAGAGYRYRGKNYFLMTGVEYQYALLENQQTFPFVQDFRYDFQNVIPMFMLRYNISQAKNLRVFYRPRTNEPSITQLQNVIDNSNPLQLSTGNPSLDQEYSHSLFMRYSASNVEKSSTFFVMLGGSLTNDYITNSTFIAQKDTLIDDKVLLQQGGQLVRPVNLNGYWNVRSFMTYGFPVSLISSNLNLNLSANYAKVPGLINQQENISNNTNLGLGVVVSSNISENVDFTISSRSNYNIATNSIQEQLNNNYFNQNTSFDLNLIFLDGIVFRNELNHQHYQGLSEGFDQNYLLWNMSLGKKFLKNDQAELSLSVFDLLKQNTSINRVVTDAFLEDVRTNVLQQFFMLTFTYNIRNFRI